MPDVVDLSDARLAGLRQREQLARDADQQLLRSRLAHSPTADAYLWALRVALELRADSHGDGEVLERDPELEREGEMALAALDEARQAVAAARAAVAAEIAMLVQRGGFRVGDTITRDGGELRCESIFTPEHEPKLAEVTFTADGGPIEKAFHSWPLDALGQPIVEEGFAPVRYERWWGGGLRNGGFVHPGTRKIVETD